MLILKYSARFKKDLKKYKNNIQVINELSKVLNTLTKQKQLPEKYSDHQLRGVYARYRECHVKPDMLLIYRTDNTFLYLARIGSHSELF